MALSRPMKTGFEKMRILPPFTNLLVVMLQSYRHPKQTNLLLNLSLALTRYPSPLTNYPSDL